MRVTKIDTSDLNKERARPADGMKARRGAHGLETITVPPNDVFLSLHGVFLGRVKFGCHPHNLRVVGSNPTPETSHKTHLYQSYEWVFVCLERLILASILMVGTYRGRTPEQCLARIRRPPLNRVDGRSKLRRHLKRTPPLQVAPV